jgi:hypothetical protein
MAAVAPNVVQRPSCKPHTLSHTATVAAYKRAHMLTLTTLCFTTAHVLQTTYYTAHTGFMAAAAQLDSVGESAWTSSCVSTALAADLQPTAATAVAVPQVLSPEHRAARELCAVCCCNAAVAAFKLQRYSDCTAAASRATTKSACSSGSSGNSAIKDGLAGGSDGSGSSASIIKPLYWRARAKVSVSN